MTDIELSYTATRKFLKTCSWKMTRTVMDGDDATEVAVLFDGKWRSLGRMDDCDQVRSAISETTDLSFYRNPVAYYRKNCLGGALVTEDEFFVIDSGTDG